MNKKLIGCIAVILALVCGIGGISAYKYSEQLRIDNEKIAAELATIPDITLMEGEMLPEATEAFSEMTMINKDTMTVDIQNVDVTVPGTYEVVYSFQDIKGQERTKTVSCTVIADLEIHVDGMEDMIVDYAEELPEEELSFDSYVDSVIRDDSKVDIMEPGTYPITYTILGVDGEMSVVERNCVVLDTRPAPTQTSEIIEEEERLDSDETTQYVKSGNIENTTVMDHTVETADPSKVILYLFVFICGIFIVSGISKKIHDKI